MRETLGRYKHSGIGGEITQDSGVCYFIEVWCVKGSSKQKIPGFISHSLPYSEAQV